MSEESTEIVSSLSSLKKPAKKPATRKKGSATSTRKKSPSKAKSTKAKSASSRSGSTSTRRATTKKGAARKKTTTKSSSSSRTKPTLRADLKKYAGESYNAEDLISGVTTILSREGTEILRDAVTAFLANKVPIMGEMLNDSLVDGLIGKLTDDYGKVKAAERKGIRAVINWLDGEFDPGGELESGLVSLLNNAPSPANEALDLSVSDFVAEGDAKPRLKPLRS
ncbi:MAG: hypothetical protein R2911_16065 [Caldilineaceae bacterium]